MFDKALFSQFILTSNLSFTHEALKLSQNEK